MKRLTRLLFLSILPIAGVAQLNSFDYFKEINPVFKTDYYKIRVGSAIIDRPGYYRVYELNEKDTVEVPYIFENYYNYKYHSTHYKNLPIIDASYIENKWSLATLVIDTNLIYNSVYLNFDGENFFKTVTIEGSQDNKNWQTIIENEKVFHYYKSVFDNHYHNRINFSPISFKYLRIKTDDTDSSPLKLSSAYLPFTQQIQSSQGENLELSLARKEEKQDKATILEGSFNRKYFISYFQLKVDHDNNFKRNIEVELLTDNTSNDKWVDFASGTISSLSSNKIFLSNTSNGDAEFKTQKFRIKIFNLDDIPLKDIKVEAFTHEQFITLKLENNKKYVLAYGKSNDVMPQYDLANFKNSIQTSQEEIILGAETKISHQVIGRTEPLISNKIWIWIALATGIIVVGVFAMRMLKENKS